MNQIGKCIIFSAPSGAGKTTIVKALLEKDLGLSFSISACSREPRPNEIDGKDYYFLGLEGFKTKIEQNAFLEWEEVYTNNFYGTLKSELDRIWSMGKTVIFDVDVVGGLHLKEIFNENALAIFVQAPDIETLEARLRHRSTETEEKILQRIEKASIELPRAKEFDRILINEDLQQAINQAEIWVKDFIQK